jgi:hypothetical protein
MVDEPVTSSYWDAYFDASGQLRFDLNWALSDAASEERTGGVDNVKVHHAGPLDLYDELVIR